MTTSDERLDRLGRQVDDWLKPYVTPEPGLVSPFYGMLAYHLGWATRSGTLHARPIATGKRVRPLLAMLVCEALGGTIDDARGPAVAVELIHNFSLVHDDIQDQSDFRRGRETVWHIWGAAQAINVGDSLFALAQLALVEGLQRHPRLAEAVRHLNQTCVRLVEGQFLDLQFETVETISLSQYSRMIARKSAALIECACALGALTAGADADTIAGCADFGHRLGLGFQAQDDVLGVWGDPAVTGKPVYADIRSRKKSLPMVLALELADGNARKRLEHLVAPARRLGEPEIHEILSIMAALGVRERAEEIATEHFVAAEAALRRALPPGRNGELRAVCARLRARDA